MIVSVSFGWRLYFYFILSAQWPSHSFTMNVIIFRWFDGARCAKGTLYFSFVCSFVRSLSVKLCSPIDWFFRLCCVWFGVSTNMKNSLTHTAASFCVCACRVDKWDDDVRHNAYTVSVCVRVHILSCTLKVAGLMVNV